jgi:hypothetical protein
MDFHDLSSLQSDGWWCRSSLVTPPEDPRPTSDLAASGALPWPFAPSLRSHPATTNRRGCPCSGRENGGARRKRAVKTGGDRGTDRCDESRYCRVGQRVREGSSRVLKDFSARPSTGSGRAISHSARGEPVEPRAAPEPFSAPCRVLSQKSSYRRGGAAHRHSERPPRPLGATTMTAKESGAGQTAGHGAARHPRFLVRCRRTRNDTSE